MAGTSPARPRPHPGAKATPAGPWARPVRRVVFIEAKTSPGRQGEASGAVGASCAPRRAQQGQGLTRTPRRRQRGRLSRLSHEFWPELPRDRLGTFWRAPAFPRDPRCPPQIASQVSGFVAPATFAHLGGPKPTRPDSFARARDHARTIAREFSDVSHMAFWAVLSAFFILERRLTHGPKTFDTFDTWRPQIGQGGILPHDTSRSVLMCQMCRAGVRPF